MSLVLAALAHCISDPLRTVHSASDTDDRAGGEARGKYRRGERLAMAQASQ